ncbi:unnamed protein product [Tetraodon nigroviridis]|uniref:(spotted green pufferfish) hypothetical protein n=1 Tax=Tetraodon nigroviridis TaxID=99883 RepID=Q4RXS9_TETNG|nr:unnamed protein product [Tetraodon nigroviridis]
MASNQKVDMLEMRGEKGTLKYSPLSLGVVFKTLTLLSPTGWKVSPTQKLGPPLERKLCAFPFIEVYSSDVIKYMAPLSRQTDFFVPEMKEEVKTDVKEEDSDEDRGTDITGADSHSDVSSVSGGVPWDSRETSLAASTAASLASSLPLRDVMDTSDDAKPRDQSDGGSNGSVGSGSSFEELDMDQEEQEGADRAAGGKKDEEEEEEEHRGEDGAAEAAEQMPAED